MSENIIEINVDELVNGDKLLMNLIVKDGIYTHRFYKGQLLTDESIQILKNANIKKVYIDYKYRNKGKFPFKIKSIRTIELVPGMKIVNNVYTDKGVLITPGNKIVDENMINKLLILNIERVDIKEETFLQDNLYKIFEKIYSNIKEVLISLFKDVLAGKTINIKNLLLGITDIIIAAAVNPHNLTKLLLNTEEEKFPLIEHSSKVAALSLLIGLHLKMERDDLIRLGIAGLLHDIGKFKIPRRLWRLKTLKSEEKAIMNKHPEYGYIILSNIEKFDYRIPLTALQHHEFYDGSGYPTGLSGDNIDMFAQIVSLANYYVNKVESSENKDIHYNVLIEIIKNRDIKFQKKITNTFLSLIGYYPVNTIVKLNTQEIAKVVKVTSNAIFRPEIVLLNDKDGNKLDVPVYIKLSEHPELSIDEIIKIEE